MRLNESLFPYPRSVSGALLAFAAALPLAAQPQSRAVDYRSSSPDPETRMRWYAEHAAMAESSRFKKLSWQFLGPTNISGRVTDVAVTAPRGRSYTMYVATASGGVWKTENEGTTFDPVFEDGPSTSIGDVTLAPSNSEIVWIGTGEANIFRSSMAGCGVYKSTDAGKSFEHMGLTGTHTIPRIVIHPSDPDVVYVASSGHEWTHNSERGVYKTTDGGKSWDHVLYIDDETGVIDLVMDPSRPGTLYAAAWQRTRQRWNDPRNEDGFGGSGIYKTENGGRSWEKINEGLPRARHRGRIGIDLCRSKPEVVYAFVDNYDLADEQPEGRDSYGRERSKVIKGAEVYRSDDAGASWRKVSKSDRYMRRHSSTYGWVFGQIRVDPSDEDVIYTMGLGLNVSRDGGETFKRLRGMHGDHHALWIDPDNSDYLVNGNDGGAVVSYDGGVSWKKFIDVLPVVQFYNVGYDMAEPFRVYGSVQDHGSYRGAVDLRRGRNRIRPQEWERAPGGEASNHAVDPTDANRVYSTGFYGRIARSELGSRDTKRLTLQPEDELPRLRGQWLAPFIISPHNPRIVYHGMNHLMRSMNAGENFEKISPDLTYNDPESLGDIPFHTIFAIAESPLQFGRIYVGTDDGKVHVTHDGGGHWSEIMDGIAPHRWISRLEASRFDRDTVYMAQNGKRHDDLAPYLWRSTDAGETWESIVANIPIGPINVIREDPAHDEVLYVGTDVGVYVSVDGAASWSVLGDLPSTFVHDLVVHPRDRILIAATHGRGMYALDVKEINKRGRRFASTLSLPPELAVDQPEDPVGVAVRDLGR